MRDGVSASTPQLRGHARRGINAHATAEGAYARRGINARRLWDVEPPPGLGVGTPLEDGKGQGRTGGAGTRKGEGGWGRGEGGGN